MKLKIAATIAALALALPGLAAAKGNPHTSGDDGPAVGSIAAVCHSKPGHVWFNSHVDAFKIYYVSGDKVNAAKHYFYVFWYVKACGLG